MCRKESCWRIVVLAATIAMLNAAHPLGATGISPAPNASESAAIAVAPARGDLNPLNGFNNDCADAIEIFDGTTSYTTDGATTDGPSHAECQYDGQTYHDIWFYYYATCTGGLTVSTCMEEGGDAFYDTDLVVYNGCDCSGLALLGCNDDAVDTCTAAGTPYASRVVVPVVSGQCYLIRVGGYTEGAQGDGVLALTCDPWPEGACCDDVAGNCTIEFEPNCAGRFLAGQTCDPDPFTPPCGEGVCEHSITLWDDYGDGWNGGFVNVYVDSNLALSVTLASGSGPETVYFDASTGSTIQTVWTASSWPEESSYCIYETNGLELGCDGLGGVAPTGISVTGNCELVPCTGILYAPTQSDNAAWRAELAGLTGAPVDYYDARSSTPTLADLERYCCVFTWTNYTYADPVGFGDVLAAFVDQGGKVILGQWTYNTGQTNWLEGAIMEPGYCPVTCSGRMGDSYIDGSGTDCVFYDVHELSGAYFDQCTAGVCGFSDGLLAGGRLAAAWRDDRRVYYAPGNAGGDFTSGDTARFIANACNCGEPMDRRGACCDPYTGTCTSDVDCADCLSPLLFTSGKTCAELDPPCGNPGACCDDGTGVCTEELELNCVGRFRAGETCDPDPFTPPCGEFVPCEHSITLWDDYGDGWNGGFIDVYVDSNLVLAGVTLANGYGPETVYFDAGTGSPIQTVWTPGSWVYEPFYCVYDGNGAELGCDGMGGAQPTGITVTGNCAPPIPTGRVDITRKGSLLVFPKVELRWDDAGNLIQDTFIDISNDYPGWVSLQMYFFNGDPPLAATADDREHLGYNWVDNLITLTSNEPVYWSVANGLPEGVSPLTALDPSENPLLQGRLANDGTTDRVLRGFVVAWAVNAAGEEIRWNHLKGDALLINYDRSAAWEYNTYNFQCTSVPHGAPIGTPGELWLDGFEYELCPDLLLLDFYAVGAEALLAGDYLAVVEDTDLTLLPMKIDLRQETDGPVTTKAKFDIWNMNEVKFSNTERCFTCWDQQLLGLYEAPNHFLLANLQTNKGKARIDGMASEVVCGPESVNVPLLGVAAKILNFDRGADLGMAGFNLIGMGTEAGLLRFDPLEPPPPELPVGALSNVEQAMNRYLGG